MRKTLLILLATVLFTSCQNEINPDGTGVNEELQIAFGEEINLSEQGIRITFSDVLEDSRCPTGVQCVWAGNAKIALKLNSTNGILNSNLEPQEVDISSYTLKLISVNPYPEENIPVDKEDYIITLSVNN